MYGGQITDWNNRLLSGLRDYVANAGLIIEGMYTQITTFGGYPGRPRVSGEGESTNNAGAQTGRLGMVSAPTQITVGEAGPETIAILRNPRSMTLQPNSGGGGGSININVAVTGNNVGSEQQAEALANAIARRVEETMARRSSLMG